MYWSMYVFTINDDFYILSFISLDESKTALYFTVLIYTQHLCTLKCSGKTCVLDWPGTSPGGTGGMPERKPGRPGYMRGNIPGSMPGNKPPNEPDSKLGSLFLPSLREEPTKKGMEIGVRQRSINILMRSINRATSLVRERQYLDF